VIVRVVLSSCRISLLTSFQFPLKPFEDRDIDIAIDACGVCGSDVHTITGQSEKMNKQNWKSLELTSIR
jgi:D-arabinose 1-dehydrogenase-like Zn-dependent alcohol dehydrogenase